MPSVGALGMMGASPRGTTTYKVKGSYLPPISPGTGSKTSPNRDCREVHTLRWLCFIIITMSRSRIFPFIFAGLTGTDKFSLHA
jgi:hypothetical protein